MTDSKHSTLLGLLAVALLQNELLAQIPQEPIVQLLFNNNASIQESTGQIPINGFVQNPAKITALVSESISGKANDRCFDNTASNGMGDPNQATGTGIMFFGNVPEIDSLGALTVTMWYRTDSGISLNDGGGRLIENGRDWLIFSDDPNRLRLEINLEGESSGIGNFPESAEWVFLGVTFDSNADTAVYFKGTQTTRVTEIVTRANYTQTMPGRSNPFLIGNNEALSRSFDGCIDNVRIWDVALNESQLEEVRLADINGISTVTPTVLSETYDAGSFTTDALKGPYNSELNFIRGNFLSIFDHDLYRISMTDFENFSATLTANDSGFGFEGQLLLFNQFGHLVAAAIPDSSGSINLTAGALGSNWGLHFLAATPKGLIPESSGGAQASFNYATGDVTLLASAAQPLSSWTFDAANLEGGGFSYSIELQNCFNSTRDYPISFTEFELFDGLVAVGYDTIIGEDYIFRSSSDFAQWEDIAFTATDNQTQVITPSSPTGQGFFQLVGPIQQE